MIPWLSKKQMSIDFSLDLLILTFLGRGEFAVCHSRIWRIVSGSYSKIHDSSPVITWLKNSGSFSRRARKSRHTSLRLAFCSVVRFYGTILEHTILMSKPCVKIWWTGSNLTHYWSFSTSIDDLTSQETSLFPHCGPFLRLKVFPHEIRLPLVLGLLKRNCAIWILVPWIGNVLHKPFVSFHKSQ